MTDPAAPIDSPCVRNCCLDDQNVCMGCHRTLTEICGWQAASREEKLAILERCAGRAAEKRERQPRREW